MPLPRAEAYLEAGADGIMIHSKSKDGEEILEFCRRFQLGRTYRTTGGGNPVPIMPSRIMSWWKPVRQLLSTANHMLRSAYPSMMATAREILMSGCSKPVEKNLMPVGELVNLFPGS